MQQTDNYSAMPGSELLDVRGLWRAVRRYLWLVISVWLTASIVIAIQAYRARSLYTATARVAVGEDAANSAKTIFGPAVPDDGSGESGDLLMDEVDSLSSQMLTLQSRGVGEDIVSSLKLDQDQRFLDRANKSVWEAIRSICDRLHSGSRRPEGGLPATVNFDAPPSIVLGNSDATSKSMLNAGQVQPAPKPGPEAAPIHSRTPDERSHLAPYVDVLNACLSIDGVPETGELEIAFTHPDADIAASVANAMARTFVEQDSQAWTAQVAKGLEWLNHSSLELREKATHAEAELAAYMRDNNLFFDGHQRLLTSDKFRRLSDQLIRAEAEVVLKQSLYDEVKAGRVAQLPQALADQQSDSGAFFLRRRIRELAVDRAQLESRYGHDNPAVKQLEEQRRVLQGQLFTQIIDNRQSTANKIAAEYARALQEQRALATALETARREVSQRDSILIKYNILKQEAETAAALYLHCVRDLNDAKERAAEQHSSVKLAGRAEPPTSPSGPNRQKTILTGMILGLMAGVGLALLLEGLDNTLKTVDAVGRLTNIRVLGVIPGLGEGAENRGLLGRARLAKRRWKRVRNGVGAWERTHLAYRSFIGERSPLDAPPPKKIESSIDPCALLESTASDLPATDPQPGAELNSSLPASAFPRTLDESTKARSGSPAPRDNSVVLVAASGVLESLDGASAEVEAYRVLRAALLLSIPGGLPKTTLVASGQQADGKTTTAVNVALSLAQLGASVVLVDCDLRAPGVHRAFGVEGVQGVSTFLTSDVPLEGLITELSVPNLSLLPCGPIPPNPAELIGSERMREMLASLSMRYDYVLIDSPPIVSVTDPVILSTMVGGVLLVVRGGDTRREVVHRACQEMAAVRARILGVVLNDANLKGDRSNYDYYRRYYYNSGPIGKKALA